MAPELLEHPGRPLRVVRGVREAPGGLFLAGIALLPILVSKWFNIPNTGFGGTSVLIVVGVLLDTIAQVEHLVEPGEIGPDDVHTSGIHVQRVVHVGPVQVGIEQRTVRA